MAGKNRANAPSAIVLGCETGVGIASWIGDVFGTRRRSTTPMPTPVLIRTRPDRTTRPSGIDRSKNGRDMPRKETNPPHRKGTKNDRTTHRRHGQDGRFHDSDVASDEVTGAIIAIEGPKSLQLSDATAIVGGVQKRLTDKVEIIWGLNFTDEDVLHATVLARDAKEITAPGTTILEKKRPAGTGSAGPTPPAVLHWAYSFVLRRMPMMAMPAATQASMARTTPITATPVLARFSR